MDDDLYITLSSLEDYMYCKRRYQLKYIEGLTGNNAKLALGKVFHENTDNGRNFELRNGILTCRHLPVSSEKLKINGICDIVEFNQSENGVKIFGREGYWNITSVEYKLGGVDAMTQAEIYQLCAQTLCLEEMFSTTINFGYIFNGKIRQRQSIHLTPELKNDVSEVIKSMHHTINHREMYNIKESKRCKNCSMYEQCSPLSKKYENTVKYIDSYIGGLDEETIE